MNGRSSSRSINNHSTRIASFLMANLDILFHRIFAVIWIVKTLRKNKILSPSGISGLNKLPTHALRFIGRPPFLGPLAFCLSVGFIVMSRSSAHTGAVDHGGVGAGQKLISEGTRRISLQAKDLIVDPILTTAPSRLREWL